VFENRVLRRIFGPKREEVITGWRRLHNGDLRNLNVSRNIIRVVKLMSKRQVGYVEHMGEMRNAYNISVGKRERKKPRGRPRSRWEDNIIMDLREIGREGVDWIHLAQDRDQWRWAMVGKVMNLRVP
jgi:hypothetical protein